MSLLKNTENEEVDVTQFTEKYAKKQNRKHKQKQPPVSGRDSDMLAQLALDDAQRMLKLNVTDDADPYDSDKDSVYIKRITDELIELITIQLKGKAAVQEHEHFTNLPNETLWLQFLIKESIYPKFNAEKANTILAEHYSEILDSVCAYFAGQDVGIKFTKHHHLLNIKSVLESAQHIIETDNLNSGIQSENLVDNGNYSEKSAEKSASYMLLKKQQKKELEHAGWLRRMFLKRKQRKELIDWNNNWKENRNKVSEYCNISENKSEIKEGMANITASNTEISKEKTEIKVDGIVFFW